MVKAVVIPDREGRRRHRLEQRVRSHHRRLLKLATFSPSPPSHHQQQQLQGEDTQHNNSATTQDTSTATVHKSPATPKSLSVIRRKKMRMKRSRSPTSSSHYSPSSSSRYSPSPSSSHYSPSSLSCSSSSSPSMSLSPLQISGYSATKINTFAQNSSFFNPNSPAFSSLPPRPSPELLRRTVSDPVQLLPHSTSLTPQKSTLRSVSRNLMGQLPPLPPSASPPSQQQQQHLLRRTISDPVPLTSSPDFKQEKQKGKMIEQAAAVEAEKLPGEWFVVKFNCDCGQDNHYLVNASDSKYFKVLW